MLEEILQSEMDKLGQADYNRKWEKAWLNIK